MRLYNRNQLTVLRQESPATQGAPQASLAESLSLTARSLAAYVTLATAQVITGLKTFNTGAGSAPFLVTGGVEKVINLDADKLDGYDETAFAKLADNETVEGLWTFSQTVTVPTVDTGFGAVELAAGVWTPTLTIVTNLSAVSALVGRYLRVGNVCTAAGAITADPTAAGLTSVRLSLPVASNFAATTDCSGTAASRNVAGQSAALLGDTVNDEASMQWTAVDTSNQTMHYIFAYVIK